MSNIEPQTTDTDVAILSEKGITYKIYVPNQATDYIQKKLMQSRKPYEIDMLRDMSSRLSLGDMVIDVGANIGNHSLFLASVSRCEVIAFEPNTALVDALKHSVALNDLDDSVTVYAKGVGFESGSARLIEDKPENLGGQSLSLGEGEVSVITLDSVGIDKCTRAIKIDVEGMEMDVLHGAKHLIAKDRPILYVESATEPEFLAVLGLMRDWNYLHWDTFNATPTHLFLPAETLTDEEQLHHIRTRQVLESYRVANESRKVRDALAAANRKYRNVASQLTEARTSRDVLQAEKNFLVKALETAKSDLDPVVARENIEKQRVATLEADIVDFSREFEDMRAKYSINLEELTKARIALSNASERNERIERALYDLRKQFINEGIPQFKPTAELTPALVAAWAQALPLPTEQIASHWTDLSENIRQRYPEKALVLLRIAYSLNPESSFVARKLVNFLIESGAGQEGLGVLTPFVDRVNLSSRENRLLALAQAGYEGEDLRMCASQAVRSRLRVATVMDEFTAAGYSPECDLQQLSINEWQMELEAFQPELLLIESAWRGLDEEWTSKIGHMSAELLGILAWCKRNGVPTAFWNKEDPVHFETFLNTAQKFDLIFTTDVDCIPRYKIALKHDRVHLLPFACQPEIHNPLEIAPRKDAFCFAGAYYARYPERTRDLDDFLCHLSKDRPFEIFDRNFGKDHPDYMFPDAYQRYIVGTLPPDEIDRAYKGYTFGINLNSVKNSQSMYARRVFELLASNTRVVSNYSVGLRRMFGDLVISTDSGEGALELVRRQDDCGAPPRLKLAGLRKVLSEHTYSHRLGRIARLAGVDIPDPAALPDVTVLAQIRDQSQADKFLSQLSRQTLQGLQLVIVVPENVILREGDLSFPLQRLNQKQAAEIRLGDLTKGQGWFAGLVPEDYYGPNYLTDLILATRYSQATVIGKAAHHKFDAGDVMLIEGTTYGSVDQLALRRALVRCDRVSNSKLDIWLQNLPSATLEDENLLALDSFGYCEKGARDSTAVAQVSDIVDDLTEIDQGLTMAELTTWSDAMIPSKEVDISAPLITGATLATGMAMPKTGKLTWTTDSKEFWHLTSTLEDTEHHYVYEKKARPLADIRDKDGNYRMHPLVGPGLNVRFVAIWLDANMQRLSHQIFASSRTIQLEPPEGTAFVRLGIRPRGQGSCVVQGLILGNHYPVPRSIFSGSRVLLLTNNYPSYQDLYRNGFVHSRVRAYGELGNITPDIFRLRPQQDLSWHEFQNINCMTGSAEQLDFMLETGEYDHILVHFLDEDMWQVLERYINRIRVTVWVHGAEVQPWWRRIFNHTTDEKLQRAKAASDLRLAFWRGLFAPLSKNLDFVFVSQYFAEEVFEDLQVTCPSNQYEIIHNPIDDQLFTYEEKPKEQRCKILSIRPFASPKYANDQTVKAILALQKYDFFDQLEFRIIGDGVLFDEITAPLAGISNIICERRFLSQPEIAELHKQYGIFLNPTRMDAQGVSRDEAMSSGLVPITSKVAAIPEFVDEQSGYLAEPEDAEGLALAIVDLWKNPDVFAAKSRAAAERVRRQSSKAKIINKELALIKGEDPLM